MSNVGNMGILVGGGPAPGINSVIGAATIRARLSGLDVLGIQARLQVAHAGRRRPHRAPHDREREPHPLQGRIVRGHLAVPTPRSPRSCSRRRSCRYSALDVTHLITIGGDDTAYSALRLEQHSAGRLRVVHVPKTIDNDLDLPSAVNTFGFQTARHLGCDIVKNLMVDARTTSRWYFVISMGRKAGHLALGIGKSAGATLTLIPEEFYRKPIPLKDAGGHAGRRDHQEAQPRPARRRGGDRGRRRAQHRSPPTSPH